MTPGHPGHGDTGTYPCPLCPAELTLDQLLDHLTTHHTTTEQHTGEHPPHDHASTTSHEQAGHTAPSPTTTPTRRNWS